MSVETTPIPVFARRPLNASGKVALVALLGAGASSGVLALAIGFPDNTALLIVTACLFVAAALLAIGWRWMPLLIALLSAVFLYQIARQPFVTYHLVNPQAGGFFAFVMDVLIIAFMLVTLVAAIGALVRNYGNGEQRTPRWLPSLLTGVAGMVVGAILIASIAQTGASATGTTYQNGVPAVHMSAGNFDQSAVTIAKGSKLRLVDDVAVVHILANGSWQNGTPRAASEAGAPVVHNVQLNGNSVDIGPFTTAGTYHIYCTVHQGMNLTVTVH